MRTYPDGIKQAILALSFFRSRFDGRKRYKHSIRKSHIDEMVPVYREHVRIARKYIKAAREFGFRGSVTKEVMI